MQHTSPQTFQNGLLLVAGIWGWLSGRAEHAEDGDDVKNLNQDWDGNNSAKSVLRSVNEAVDMRYNRVDHNHTVPESRHMGGKISGGETHRNTGRHGHTEDGTHYPK